MEGGLCFPCDAALGADHLVAYFASAPRMRPSPTDRVSQGARRTQTALVRNTRCQRRASTSPVFNMPGHTGVGRGHRFSNMVEGRPNLETRRRPKLHARSRIQSLADGPNFLCIGADRLVRDAQPDPCSPH